MSKKVPRYSFYFLNVQLQGNFEIKVKQSQKGAQNVIEKLAVSDFDRNQRGSAIALFTFFKTDKVLYFNDVCVIDWAKSGVDSANFDQSMFTFQN